MPARASSAASGESPIVRLVDAPDFVPIGTAGLPTARSLVTLMHLGHAIRTVGRPARRSAVLLAALAGAPAVVIAQPAPVPHRVAQLNTPPAPAVRPAAPASKKAAPPRSAANPSDIVARVGATSISATEIRAFIAELGPRERAALSKDRTVLSREVRAMLARRLVLQEAAAKKFDQQPDIAEQLERARDNVLVEAYLRSVASPPANYPGEELVQKVYDANPKAFLVPRQFRLAQIFVAVAQDADKAAEDKARKIVDDIMQRLRAPAADVAAIAGEMGASNGGDLGWLPETDLLPEIRTRVVELDKAKFKGLIKEPIKLDDGWHIVKLLDSKEPTTRTLPEVHDALVQRIRNERAAVLRRAYLAELLKQHPPEINEMALSGLAGEETPPAR
jgi:peptidylprolyl isomerase